MIDLIIIGAGGFAKSVLDCIDEHIYNVRGFLDDYKNANEHLGFPILGNSVECIDNPKDYLYFIAIGDNNKRRAWYNKLKDNELKVINVIDRSAIVSKNAKLGEGCFIGKMAIVNSNATIGNNCIINTKALVEHGCFIDNNVNISTNTALNGDVTIGDSTFVGSCSVINGQITIGKNVMVGSGAVVINNVEDNCTVAGIPARVIKKDGIRV